VDETGQPYAYTGDDPLNAVDPLGTSLISSAWDATGGKVVHGVKTAAVDTGHFFSDPSRWRDEANYWSGVANGILSTLTLDQVHVSAPYCDALGWAYGVGTGIGVSVGLVGAAAGGEAAAGSLTVDADAAPTSSLERVGSGLKSDLFHRATSWVVDDPGAVSTLLVGGDGVPVTSYSLPGEVNGIAGMFNWIIDSSGEQPVVTHQLFTPGG